MKIWVKVNGRRLLVPQIGEAEYKSLAAEWPGDFPIGLPQVFAIVDGGLRFFPLPDALCKMEIEK